MQTGNAMSDVTMDFALVVGADLIRRAELSKSGVNLGHLLEKKPVLGAWILRIGERDFMDENLWDQLDAIFAQLTRAIRTLTQDSAKVQMQWPETKLECSIERSGDSLIVRYEQNEAICSYRSFLQEAIHMLREFANLVESCCPQTPVAFEVVEAFLAEVN